MRLGPGISYSTYTMFNASLENLRVVFLYSGRSAGDRGSVASVPNELFKNDATSAAFLSSNRQDKLKCMESRINWTRSCHPSASRRTEAMRVWNPWQTKHCAKSVSLPVDAGSSCLAW